MNLTQAQDNYEANQSQSDHELAESIRLSECTHPVTTVAGDDSVPDGVYCDSCGKGFSVEDWCAYKENQV